MSLSAIQIEERLEAIEADMAERWQEFATAAAAYHRLVRDYELRVARVKLGSSEKTETAKKDRALDAIAAADDGLYENLKDAEGKYEGAKAAFRALEARAMIGMSLLKRYEREPSRIPDGQMFGGRRAS